jgi:hypothetical protein
VLGYVAWFFAIIVNKDEMVRVIIQISNESKTLLLSREKIVSVSYYDKSGNGLAWLRTHCFESGRECDSLNSDNRDGENRENSIQVDVFLSLKTQKGFNRRLLEDKITSREFAFSKTFNDHWIVRGREKANIQVEKLDELEALFLFYSKDDVVTDVQFVMCFPGGFLKKGHGMCDLYFEMGDGQPVKVFIPFKDIANIGSLSRSVRRILNEATVGGEG